MSLTENTIRRLVLVRQMYLHGIRHVADSTEIGRVIAIQAIDYAIEMLLKSIVSHFGSPKDYSPPERGYYNKLTNLKNQRYSPKMDFYRLWDEVLAIFRDSEFEIPADELPLRREIDTLHMLRNDIQHNGIVPARDEVRKYAAYAESFIYEVSTNAFGKPVEEITLASLICNTEISQLIFDAERQLDDGQFRESIVSATKAFELATQEERQGRPYRKRLPHNLRSNIQRLSKKIDSKQIFQNLARTISDDFRFQNKFERAGQKLDFSNIFDDLGQYLEIFQQEIESLQESLEVIALGGDLRQYMRFRQLSPRLIRVLSGEIIVNSRPDWEPTKEDATEVLSFVFDTILRWEQLPLADKEF